MVESRAHDGELDELLGLEGLEAVVIATPVSTHFELALAALKRKKHVLITKPFTHKAEEAVTLVRTARELGLVLFVDHTFLFTSAAFLLIPLRTATEYANKIIRARVSARRICRVLAASHDYTDPDSPAASPPAGSMLADARTGVHVQPGMLTALVAILFSGILAEAERSADTARHEKAG